MKRLGLGFVTLFFVSIIIFSSIEMLPGDFSESVLGHGTSFSGRAASGNNRARPVAELIAPRLKNTLFLAGITALVAVPLALLLGVATALYRNSLFDRISNATTLTTISFPDFFVAYLLILIFYGTW